MEKAKKMLNGFGSFKLHLDREHFLTEDLYKQTWGEGTHWHNSRWGLNASGLVGLCLGPRLEGSHSGRNSHPLETAVDNYYFVGQ